MCERKNLENKLSIPDLKIQEGVFHVIFNTVRVSLQQDATLSQSNYPWIKLEAEWAPWKLFLGPANYNSISMVSSLADMS